MVGGRFHRFMLSSGASPHQSIIQNGPLLFCVATGWRTPDGFGSATEGNAATQILTLLTLTILSKIAVPSLLYRKCNGSVGL